MTYNVFNFDERQPDLYHYDFGFCYMADQKEEVTFKLPGSHWSLIQANKKQFYYFLLLGISGALDLTSTRISGINVSDNRQPTPITQTNSHLPLSLTCIRTHTCTSVHMYLHVCTYLYAV